jgi:general secretion pathway protein F
MPLFQFEALTYSGKTERGTVEGESLRAVRQLLLNKELVPISITDVALTQAAVKERSLFSSQRSISAKDLAILSKQLALLVRSGISIEDGISILSEDSNIKKHTHKVLDSVLGDIRSGMPLSQALANHPQSFGAFYQGIVAAAEQSGQMAEVLTQLAVFLEKREALKQKALGALVYPITLVSVSIGVIIFLMTYVVPQIVRVFESTKQKMPVITQIVMAISNFLSQWGLILLLAGLLSTLIFKYLLRRPEFKYRCDAFYLKIPVVGALLLEFETARFAGTMALLVGTNIPILSALHYSKNTLSNLVLKQTIERAEARLSEGSSLAKAIANQGIFSPILVHLIRSGEASGQLAEMLRYAAENAEAEAEHKTKIFTNLLEPVLILVMGGLVLGIVMAVMQPILEMNNGIR